MPKLVELLRYAKPVLELSGLMLSIVNGLMLLRYYLRDRARLRVQPIHSEVYQWWFALPPGEFESKPTRRYGFVTYMAVQNSGLRKTQLTSWRLFIRSRRGGVHELKPINMPEPSAKIGTHIKLYPVLGQRGQHFEGDTLVDSGCSTSGMVYYFYECYGDEWWDPKTSGDQIEGSFQVSDGFKGTAKCIVRFKRKPLEEIQVFAPGIEMMGIEPVEHGEAFQEASPDAPSLGGAIAAELKLRDTDGFFTQDGIKHVIEYSDLSGAAEKVRRTLLLFKTSTQRTWLAASDDRLFCVLDDAKTRRSGNLIQWTIRHEESRPVVVKLRTVDIGNKKKWLYSSDLHSGEELRKRIEDLLKR